MRDWFVAHGMLGFQVLMVLLLLGFGIAALVILRRLRRLARERLDAIAKVQAEVQQVAAAVAAQQEVLALELAAQHKEVVEKLSETKQAAADAYHEANSMNAKIASVTERVVSLVAIKATGDDTNARVQRVEDCVTHPEREDCEPEAKA